MRRVVRVVTVLALLGGTSAVARSAEETRETAVVVQNQTFSPAEIHVKAGAPFILAVTNRDKTSARFESQSLKIEKVIPPGQTVRMRVPALRPGTYPFAKGRIVAE
jgi:heme/copper-type cytochrome/quinol oxidase subunit 2